MPSGHPGPMDSFGSGATARSSWTTSARPATQGRTTTPGSTTRGSTTTPGPPKGPSRRATLATCSCAAGPSDRPRTPTRRCSDPRHPRLHRRLLRRRVVLGHHRLHRRPGRRRLRHHEDPYRARPEARHRKETTAMALRLAPERTLMPEDEELQRLIEIEAEDSARSRAAIVRYLSRDLEAEAIADILVAKKCYQTDKAKLELVILLRRTAHYIQRTYRGRQAMVPLAKRNRDSQTAAGGPAQAPSDPTTPTCLPPPAFDLEDDDT